MSKGGWACPVCTFFNPPAQLQSCEMCSSPNPAEAAIEASPENEFTKVRKQAMVDKYIFWEDVGTALQHALATKETEAAHGFLVECLEEILTIVTNQDFFPQAPKPVLSNICCMAAELCGYELQERNSTQLMAACNTLFDTGRKYWGSLPVDTAAFGHILKHSGDTETFLTCIQKFSDSGGIGSVTKLMNDKDVQPATLSLLFLLFKGAAPHLDVKLKGEIAGATRNALMAMPDQALKTDTKAVDTLLRNLHDPEFLGDDCIDAMWKPVALVCFRSDILHLRLFAQDLLQYIYENTHFPNRLEWFKAETILPLMFGARFAPPLIMQGSTNFLLTLMMKHKELEESTLELIWKSCLGRHTSVSSAVHGLLHILWEPLLEAELLHPLFVAVQDSLLAEGRYIADVTSFLLNLLSAPDGPQQQSPSTPFAAGRVSPPRPAPTLRQDSLLTTVAAASPDSQGRDTLGTLFTLYWLCLSDPLCDETTWQKLMALLLQALRHDAGQRFSLMIAQRCVGFIRQQIDGYDANFVPADEMQVVEHQQAPVLQPQSILGALTPPPALSEGHSSKLASSTRPIKRRRVMDHADGGRLDVVCSPEPRNHHLNPGSTSFVFRMLFRIIQLADSLGLDLPWRTSMHASAMGEDGNSAGMSSDSVADLLVSELIAFVSLELAPLKKSRYLESRLELMSLFAGFMNTNHITSMWNVLTLDQHLSNPEVTFATVIGSTLPNGLHSSACCEQLIRWLILVAPSTDVGSTRMHIFDCLLCEHVDVRTMWLTAFECFQIYLNLLNAVDCTENAAKRTNRVWDIILEAADPGVAQKAIELLLTLQIQEESYSPFVTKVFGMLQNPQSSISSGTPSLLVQHVERCVSLLQALAGQLSMHTHARPHASRGRGRTLRITVIASNNVASITAHTKMRLADFVKLANVALSLDSSSKISSLDVSGKFTRKLDPINEGSCTLQELNLEDGQTISVSSSQQELAPPPLAGSSNTVQSQAMTIGQGSAIDEIAHTGKFYDILFNLLSQVGGGSAELPEATQLMVWLFLVSLPSNVSVLAQLQSLSAGWEAVFDKSPWQVLYALIVIDALLLPIDSEGEQQAAEWGALFMGSGGVSLLVNYLARLDSMQVTEGGGTLQMPLEIWESSVRMCLRAVNHFCCTDQANVVPTETVSPLLSSEGLCQSVVNTIRTLVDTNTDAVLDGIAILTVMVSGCGAETGDVQYLLTEDILGPVLMDHFLISHSLEIVQNAACQLCARILDSGSHCSSQLYANPLAERMCSMLAGRLMHCLSTASKSGNSPSLVPFFTTFLRCCKHDDAAKSETLFTKLSSFVCEPLAVLSAQTGLNVREEELLFGVLGLVCLFLEMQPELIQSVAKCVTGTSSTVTACISPALQFCKHFMSCFLVDVSTVDSAEGSMQPCSPLQCSPETVQEVCRVLTTVATSDRDTCLQLTLIITTLLDQAPISSSLNGWLYDPSVEQKSAVHGFVGLKNQGSTCYMNAVLQQLYFYPPFRSGMLDLDVAGSADAGDTVAVLPELQRSFCFLKGSAQRAFDPLPLVKASAALQMEFSAFEQNDAAEYLDKLLDHLSEQSPDAKALVERCFGGRLVFHKRDIEKGCCSQRDEAFIRLELPVLPRLEDCLRELIKPELMEHENKVHCQTCGCNRDTMRRTLLGTLPNLLVINLKRFQLNFQTFQPVKVQDKCEFPLHLNVFPYTVTGAELAESGKSPALTAQSVSDYTYTLRGVVVHSGTADCGHYYSYSVSSGRWYLVDDENVSEIDPSILSEKCHGGQYDVLRNNSEVVTVDKKFNAYLLFYEKTSSSLKHLSHLQAPLASGAALPPLSLDSMALMPAEAATAADSISLTAAQAAPGSAAQHQQLSSSACLQEVSSANQQVLQRYALFHPKFLQFSLQLYDQALRWYDMEPLSMPAGAQLKILKFGITMYLNVVSRAKEVHDSANLHIGFMTNLLQGLLDSADGSLWFIHQLLITPASGQTSAAEHAKTTWLCSLLIHSENMEVQHATTRLIGQALETCLTAGNDELVQFLISADGSGPSPLLYRFMWTLRNLLPEVAAHWDCVPSFAALWQRLSAIAQASADQTLAKLLLYNVQAVQVLAHLYLSEGPVAMDGSPDVSFGVIEGGSVESTSWWVKQGVDTTLPVLPALGDIYASPDHSTTVTALASLIALAQQLQSGMPGMDGMVQALTSSQIFCRKVVNNNLAAGVELVSRMFAAPCAPDRAMVMVTIIMDSIQTAKFDSVGSSCTGKLPEVTATPCDIHQCQGLPGQSACIQALLGVVYGMSRSETVADTLDALCNMALTTTADDARMTIHCASIIDELADPAVVVAHGQLDMARAETQTWLRSNLVKWEWVVEYLDDMQSDWMGMALQNTAIVGTWDENNGRTVAQCVERLVPRLSHLRALLGGAQDVIQLGPSDFQFEVQHSGTEYVNGVYIFEGMVDDSAVFALMSPVGRLCIQKMIKPQERGDAFVWTLRSVEDNTVYYQADVSGQMHSRLPPEGSWTWDAVDGVSIDTWQHGQHQSHALDVCKQVLRRKPLPAQLSGSLLRTRPHFNRRMRGSNKKARQTSAPGLFLPASPLGMETSGDDL